MSEVVVRDRYRHRGVLDALSRLPGACSWPAPPHAARRSCRTAVRDARPRAMHAPPTSLLPPLAPALARQPPASPRAPPEPTQEKKKKNVIKA